MITIRQASTDDLQAINDIYNHFILNSAITFDVKPWSIVKRHEWFLSLKKDPRQSILVALDNNEIIGFAYNAPFKPKKAYYSSTELTFYKAPECTLKGVGRALYRHLLNALKSHQYHRAYSWVTLPNPASFKLHQGLGFDEVGIMKEVGEKHGTFHDVALLEKKLC